MLWDPATGREVVVVVVGCGSGSDSTRTGVILRFFLLLLGKLSRDTNESNVVCFDISVSGGLGGQGRVSWTFFESFRIRTITWIEKFTREKT